MPHHSSWGMTQTRPRTQKAVFKFHNFANRTHHRYYLRNIFSAMYGIVGPMRRPNQITTFHATAIPIGSRKFSLPGQK